MTTDELQAKYGVCPVCGSLRVPVEIVETVYSSNAEALGGRFACKHRPIAAGETLAETAAPVLAWTVIPA